MIYFLALLPATALTIGGYFVLFLANRSEGSFRTLGKYLGFWAFTLAALVILGAIFAAAHRGHHCPMMGERGAYGRMRGLSPGDPRFFGPRGDDLQAPPQPPVGTPNPATPPNPSSPSPH
jgi:hypothetical protein